MASQKLPFDHILIHEKLNFVFLVVRQPHNRRGARRTIQILLHILRGGKAQAGNAQLMGEFLCLEGLVPRHHQQVEVRFLPVAKEQVLADRGTQAVINDHAVLHGVGPQKGMVGAPVLQPQRVQQIIGADLFFKPARTIGRAALV